MKDTKHKQKVFEDNTLVSQYYFSGGATKEKDYRILLIGLLDTHKEKMNDRVN